VNMNKNIAAFLDMIAYAEGTKGVGDDGYNVLVGSLPGKPLLFHNYKTHPRIYNKKLNSTAAGRYQILYPIFAAYKRRLGLKDFSATSQDAIAIQLIKERKAYEDILAGRISTAINKCATAWASLPGSPYGQPTRSKVVLLEAYEAFGGAFA
jgi:muramidase (phage lysozyme)